jgi:chromosome segregation ATPase
LDDLVAEQAEEISSNQALSEETQAKLKEILSFLHKNIQDQVKDADLLRDILEPIEQNLPVDIQASLKPISQLDQQFAAVRQVLKSQSLQPALEQRRAIAKQSLKDLYIQAQSNKELSARLQPALDLKKARKAELEAELRILSTEIEADEKKLAELPDLTEKIRKEASAILTEDKQLKTKLSALIKTQEAGQNLLETINRMISDAKDVISKYLGV